MDLVTFSNAIALVACLASLFAVHIALKAFRLKEGDQIRGRYSIQDSISSDDAYVCEVVLENQKDKISTVYGIYLKVGWNYFIELETFEDAPLLLGPFETTTRKLGPIDFYVFNARRIELKRLLRDRRPSKSLWLSLPSGKYKVASLPYRWDPIHEWFRNHFVVTLHSTQTKLNGKAYGGRVHFVVELLMGGEVKQTLPIHGSEHKYKWFQDLGGSAETLESASRLKNLFESRTSEIGGFEEVRVTDLMASKIDRYRDTDLNSRPAVARSWFATYVVGRTLTLVRSWLLWRRNKRTAKRNKRA